MPSNDRILLTFREWEALTNSVERLSNAVERIERDLLVTEAQRKVWLFLGGGIGGVVSGVVTGVIVHFITK